MQLIDEQSEAFGDPRFTSVDLLPTPDGARSLDSRPAFALWSVLVLHPVVSDLAVARSTLELRTLLPVLSGAALVSLMGFALLRTPQRYGLGFVATARAAFGVRGTHVVVIARWLATVIWAGAWVGYVADWATRLLLASLTRFAHSGWSAQARLWRDPIALGVAAVFVILAVRASTRRVEEQAAAAPRRVLLALVLAAVLVALAVYQLGTLPPMRVDLARWSLEHWATESLAIALATLPPLLAFAEWARLRARGGIDPESGRRLGRGKRASAPFVLIPVAAIFSTAIAFLHAAAAQATGATPQGLVASASGAGGALGGAAAVLLAVLLFFALVPFVGIDSPLRALSSLSRGRSDSGLRWLTGGAILAAAPLVRLFAPGTLMVATGVVLVPIAVVLMVDDGIVRRGRIQLEELYRAPSRYGPLFGVGSAGLLALLLGWGVSLTRWEGMQWRGLPDSVRALVNGFNYGGGSAVVLLAGSAVAVAYGVLRMLENAAPEVPARPLRGPGPERMEAAPSSLDVAPAREPNESHWERGSDDPRPTGPLDPTVIDMSEARFAPLDDSDDEWPDERGDEPDSEGHWYDDADDMSNPSVTELGDPRFIKKRGDDE